MILVSKGSVQEIADAITAALIGAADHHSRPRTYRTVDPELLTRIAHGALTAAAGETVMVAGEVLERGPEEHLPWLKTIYPRT